MSSHGGSSSERFPTAMSDVDTMVGYSVNETPRDDLDRDKGHDREYSPSTSSSRDGRVTKTSGLSSREGTFDDKDLNFIDSKSKDVDDEAVEQWDNPFGEARDSSRLESEDHTPVPTSTTKLRILQELAQMQAADDARKTQEKHNRQIEKERILKQMEEQRKSRGVTILPNVRYSRNTIEYHLKREIRSASNKEREQLKAETDTIRLEIEAKHGLSTKKETDFKALASNFYEGKKLPSETLPDHIRRSLTSEEIADLRLVFDMFDLKEKG